MAAHNLENPHQDYSSVGQSLMPFTDRNLLGLRQGQRSKTNVHRQKGEFRKGTPYKKGLSVQIRQTLGYNKATGEGEVICLVHQKWIIVISARNSCHVGSDLSIIDCVGPGYSLWQSSRTRMMLFMPRALDSLKDPGLMPRVNAGSKTASTSQPCMVNRLSVIF